MGQGATPSAMAWLLWTCSRQTAADGLSAHSTCWLSALITRSDLSRQGHFRKHLHTLGIRNDNQECRLCKQYEETTTRIVRDSDLGEGLCLVAINQMLSQALVLEKTHRQGHWLAQLTILGTHNKLRFHYQINTASRAVLR